MWGETLLRESSAQSRAELSAEAAGALSFSRMACNIGSAGAKRPFQAPASRPWQPHTISDGAEDSDSSSDSSAPQPYRMRQRAAFRGVQSPERDSRGSGLHTVTAARLGDHRAMDHRGGGLPTVKDDLGGHHAMDNRRGNLRGVASDKAVRVGQLDAKLASTKMVSNARIQQLEALLASGKVSHAAREAGFENELVFVVLEMSQSCDATVESVRKQWRLRLTAAQKDLSTAKPLWRLRVKQLRLRRSSARVSVLRNSTCERQYPSFVWPWQRVASGRAPQQVRLRRRRPSCWRFAPSSTTQWIAVGRTRVFPLRRKIGYGARGCSSTIQPMAQMSVRSSAKSLPRRLWAIRVQMAASIGA